MKIAIIGGGKMGLAIANAIGECLVIGKEDDFSNLQADMILFAVKPQVFNDVLPNYRSRGKLYISIAAGVTIAKMKALLGEDAHIVRAMPNLAISARKGTTAICRDDLTSDSEFAQAKRLFDKLGETVEVDQSHMDTVVSLSGSSPAYGFMLLSAMIDFGVSQGLSYETSLKLSANAIGGAMELALQSEHTPEELRDMVCSPNGTTIEAVNHFKSNNFEGIIRQAMQKCRNRSEELAK